MSSKKGAPRRGRSRRQADRTTDRAVRLRPQLLAAIVESSEDAIISRDLSGRITSWNRGAQELFGYTAREAIGEPLLMLVPPGLRSEEARIVDRVRRGERLRHYETTRLTRTGAAVSVSLTVSPIRDSSGAVVGAAKIIRDISERKRMESEVWQGRVRLRAVLDTAVDSIISIDGRGVIQAVNPATERMFGYAAAEMLGNNVKMLMPAPYHHEHDGYIARYRQTGEKRIIGIGREVQARRKDGSVFAVDLAVSEVEPGALFTGIIRDISDRKAAEAKLRQADRMASIGTLAAGLGHDMNNVLLPVRARLNALRAAGQRGRIPPGEGTHIEQIRRSIAYLQQLADGLHFLALDPDAEDAPRGGGAVTDLRRWWDQAGALLSKAVPRHVRVCAAFPEHLPPVAAAAHGLTQAVLNLVVNAGEAIPHPDGTKGRRGLVRIEAEAREDDDTTWVRVSVTDNGTGMSEEVKRRAFEMFFTTKPRGLGSGLGLALVQKVAERAGGRVEIDTEVGRGTKVVMILPAVRQRSREHDPARRCAVVTLADGRADALVRHILESSGMRVRAGRDAAGADVWVADSTTLNLRAARSWRAKHPRGRLVLVGALPRGGASAWQRLEPLRVEQPGDLDAVRSALARATAKMERSV